MNLTSYEQADVLDLFSQAFFVDKEVIDDENMRKFNEAFNGKAEYLISQGQNHAAFRHLLLLMKLN